ncbi:hypothetical protein AB4393_14770 [Vibrio splendidus]|uniref:hypothetical protein n=1 Tax=Vibrio splendidus TaxID=29497 RepID=UPI000C859DCA|nr:hypothetical protein [Vibrio splendidus]PMG26517.1 hypothetical protein BCU95_08605 [Vibrio splendidus]
MAEKFKYFIELIQENESAARSEGTYAYFINPVSKGDIIYWDNEHGSCGGVIKSVEHHPTVSVLIVSKIKFGGGV